MECSESVSSSLTKRLKVGDIRGREKATLAQADDDRNLPATPESENNLRLSLRPLSRDKHNGVFYRGEPNRQTGECHSILREPGREGGRFRVHRLSSRGLSVDGGQKKISYFRKGGAPVALDSGSASVRVDLEGEKGGGLKEMGVTLREVRQGR